MAKVVYVLEKYYDYEGSDAIGVYSSLEAAIKASRQYEKDEQGCEDEHRISKMEIDAPADDPERGWINRKGEGNE